MREISASVEEIRSDEDEDEDEVVTMSDDDDDDDGRGNRDIGISTTIAEDHEDAMFDPRLVATTGDRYCCSVGESLRRERESDGGDGDEVGSSSRTFVGKKQGLSEFESDYFKGMQWSPDGTTLLTSHATHTLRTFILPPDLLSPANPDPLPLSSYACFNSSEPIYATAINPRYSLQDPSSTFFICSPRDHPIRLSSALAPDTLLASYPLVSPTTERWITPYSLIWEADGRHFLAGADSEISRFDVEAVGRGPVSSMGTISSKRRRRKLGGGGGGAGGIGFRGIVSAMGLSTGGGGGSGGLLAAGTFTRFVGLYDGGGAGAEVAMFSVAGTEAETKGGIGGRGIMQVLWGGTQGRYLYVLERGSRGVLVYDIRVAGRLVGWMRGREADTMQRMEGCIVNVDDGQGGDEKGQEELWCGGVDGCVRVWRKPWLCADDDDDDEDGNGGREADWVWKVHDDATNSVLVHPTGSVFATCSGQRHDRDIGGSWDGSNSLDSDSSHSYSDSDSDSDDDAFAALDPHDNRGRRDRRKDTVVGNAAQRLQSPSIGFDNRLNVWAI